MSPAQAFIAACSGVSSCVSSDLLQSWCPCLPLPCFALHLIADTPSKSKRGLYTCLYPRRYVHCLCICSVSVCVSHCRDQSRGVISKGQGSKLSITILLRVFIPICGIGTTARPGVLLRKEWSCDGDSQPQRQSSPARTVYNQALLGQELSE